MKIGDKIVIEPISSIYSGSYPVEVTSIEEGGIGTTLPYDNGRLVLLGVGTQVYVHAGEERFLSEVLQRRVIHNPGLLVAKPGSIKRGPRRGREGPARVLAVTSGKGGVGKTSFSINYALSLVESGLRVVLVDVDLGTANVDLLLGVHPEYTLKDVVDGHKSLREVVIDYRGLKVISGGSGVLELADLSEWQFTRLISSFNELQREADLIILDTGAGVSRNVVNFLMAADEVIVVTTPEPHAMMDAYAITKVLATQGYQGTVGLVVNRTESPWEGKNTAERLMGASSQFLDYGISFLGSMPEDRAVTEAIKKQQPVIYYRPRSGISRAIRGLAAAREDVPRPAREGFLDRLRRAWQR